MSGAKEEKKELGTRGEGHGSKSNTSKAEPDAFFADRDIVKRR